MTAILKDLRSLRAARDRGEITSEQFARAEAVLHDMVEEAIVEPGTASPRTVQAPPRRTAATDAPTVSPARIWETALMIIAGLACLTMLASFALGSLTLALTLLVTTIAVGTVWALKNLDE